MRIASFNANSIRARLPIILDWLKASSPDVLCIQETKVQDPDFPREAIEEAGYNCAFKGQKSYNGVAILSTAPIEEVRCGLDDGGPPDEPRLIAARVRGIRIVNTYVPQGVSPEAEQFHYKLSWFARLRSYFERHCSPDEPLVWLGDFNVAPEPIDVYDADILLGSVCFHPDEHAALEKTREWGFVDIFRRHNHEEKQYSFWDYRLPRAVQRDLGWRIDHIWATEPLAAKSTAAWIDKEPRLRPRPSDHTFIVAEFDM